MTAGNAGYSAKTDIFFIYFFKTKICYVKTDMQEKNIRFSMGMSWLVLFSPSREQNAMELDRWLD